MGANFRKAFKFLVPSWLSEGDGALVLHSLAVIKDAFLERMRQGLEARFPSRAHSTALALTGSDRGIVRGRDETNAHYAQRLIRWRYPRGHRVRGSAFALLEQISEYFGGIEAYTIDAHGTRHTRTADGDESYAYGEAWDWDGDTVRWARFWVVLAPAPDFISEQLDFGDPDLWGGSLGTPGYSIGQQGVTSQDVAAIRRLMTGRAWKPAGTRGEWVIVSIDGTEPAPDGTWSTWSKNVAGTQVAARSGNHRYWSLSPSVNNVYSGDPMNFPEAATNVDGSGTYVGNPDNFPTSAVLPDGSSYSGDPASFPVNVQLIDDGDLPA